MQTPTTIEGLDAELRRLGFPAVFAGMDTTAPEAQNQAIALVRYQYEQGPKTVGARRRRDEAIGLIQMYIWAGKDARALPASREDPLLAAIRAVAAAAVLLLRDLPALEGPGVPPVMVMDGEDAESGDGDLELVWMDDEE